MKYLPRNHRQLLSVPLITLRGFIRGMTSSNMKLIIDTDPGMDDAVAIGMALSAKQTDIMAVTTVVGNTDTEQGTSNALALLQAFDRFDVPVFKGASSPIVPCKQTDYWHGKDGFGDVMKLNPCTNQLQEKHAVHAINELASAHPGEITLVTLGPLTNVALALKLNPKLPSQLKEMVIMGGNYRGEGNVTMTAEFNFVVDPTAAHIVFEEFSCPKYLVTWELTKNKHFTPIEVVDKYCSYNNKRAQFMKILFDAANAMHGFPMTQICDAVAMAVALDRSVITKVHHLYGKVELHGEHTAGMCCYDWMNKLGREKNIYLVDDIDIMKYRRLLLQSVES